MVQQLLDDVVLLGQAAQSDGDVQLLILLRRHAEGNSLAAPAVVTIQCFLGHDLCSFLCSLDIEPGGHFGLPEAKQVCIVVGNVDALVADTVCDGNGGEAHVDQQ